MNLYEDIAKRTNGEIYIGIVGPVRSGKSTFVKKFMDNVVIPNIVEGYDKERAKDETPQSASGRTIMTTEPKFIPDEAVSVSIGNTKMKVHYYEPVVGREDAFRQFRGQFFVARKLMREVCEPGMSGSYPLSHFNGFFQ